MTYKVYCLKDPQTNEIKYVGRTNGVLLDRLVEHIFEISSRSTSGTKAVSDKKKWIRGLVEQQLIPVIELLEETNTQAECVQREYFWQAELKMDGAQLFGRVLNIEADKLCSLVDDIKTKTKSNRALALYYGVDRKTVKLLKEIYETF